MKPRKDSADRGLVAGARLVRFFISVECFDMRPDAVNGWALRTRWILIGRKYPHWLCHKPSIRIDLLPASRCRPQRGDRMECQGGNESNESPAESGYSNPRATPCDRKATTHSDYSVPCEPPQSPHQDRNQVLVGDDYQGHGYHIPTSVERSRSPQPTGAELGEDVQCVSSLTSRIRRRRAGGVDDTTDAIRAVAYILLC